MGDVFPGRGQARGAVAVTNAGSARRRRPPAGQCPSASSSHPPACIELWRPSTVPAGRPRLDATKAAGALPAPGATVPIAVGRGQPSRSML